MIIFIRSVILLSMTIFCSLMFSCETPIITHLPKSDPKLVLNFIGTNDNPWSGKVAVSRGLLEEQREDMKQLVEGTTIRLFENGKFVAQAVDADNYPDWHRDVFYATTSFSPKAGNTYRIEAQSVKYASVSASYIHPYPVDIDEVQVKRLGTKGPVENSENIEITVIINDPADENYYEIFLSESSEAKNWNWFGLSLNFVNIQDKEKNGFNEKRSELLGSVLFSDDLFNGLKKTMVFKAYTFKSQSFPSTHCRIELRSLSKEYFKYEETAILQSLSIGDPYAQPVKVVNNIENGFGIFGGFSRTFKSAKIE